MALFVHGIGGGTNRALHAWKECTENAVTFSPYPAVMAHCEGRTLKLNDTTNTDLNYIPVKYITSENYISILESMQVFFSDHNLKFYRSESTGKLHWNKLNGTDGSFISGGEAIFDETHKMITVDGYTFDGIYSYTKLRKSGSVTIPTKIVENFVISDDAGAYPNGGVLDGYYYEYIDRDEFV